MFIYSVLSPIVLRLWVRNCNIANVNRLMVVAYMVQLNVYYCYVHQCSPSHTLACFFRKDGKSFAVIFISRKKEKQRSAQFFKWKPGQKPQTPRTR
jgi:hypothetical protein